MWQALGKSVLKYRIQLIIATLTITLLLAYQASKVELSYEFSRAIPTNNPKYIAYLDFKKKFGEDGNLLTVGFVTNQLFQVKDFNALSSFQERLKKIEGVEDIIGIPGAITLHKNDSTEKLDAIRIFPARVNDQKTLDSLKDIFYSLPFYKGILYNPETKAYLLGVRINKKILNSKAREKVVSAIEVEAKIFQKETDYELHLSGLPLIRNNVSVRIAKEMQWFFLGSILLSALILFIFFRSLSTTLLSLSVVIVGVIYSLATIHMLGFRITLLNALIPPLVVVIGIPNCIYFINKYTGEKVWNRDVYSPKTEPNSYTIINTLDGQVKIPEDALPGLNEWSGLISMITTYKGEETPTFNVSSSYLIRLISISRASAQYFSLEDELK